MNKKVVVFFYLALSSYGLFGQTPAKEAVNNFALYTKSWDFALLEKARKSIDAAFKTRKDSSSHKVNLLKCMIYSTLANVDNTRKLKYNLDPADEALHALNKLKNPQLIEENRAEIVFCKKHLANYFIRKASIELADFNYQRALFAYKMVDSLNEGDAKVKHNIAILSGRTGNMVEAEWYYLQLTEDKKNTIPAYFLELSAIYELKGDKKSSLAILQKGRLQAPDNRDILFKIINTYADNGQYAAVTSVIDEAVRMEPDNLNLNYLAAFSYDASGNRSLAEQYYRRVIDIESNNFDANYSLGLLYLDLYVRNKKEESLANTRKYLQKAEEISPNGTNVLKSLAILYKNTGETALLERINNKLNQIIFN